MEQLKCQMERGGVVIALDVDMRIIHQLKSRVALLDMPIGTIGMFHFFLEIMQVQFQ